MRQADKQLRMDLEAAQRPKAARCKRRRFQTPPETDRSSVRRGATCDGPALLVAPVVVQCGFCGTRVTVMAEVARCSRCGGIVGRSEE